MMYFRFEMKEKEKRRRKEKKKKQNCRSIVLEIYGLFQEIKQVAMDCATSIDTYHQDYKLLWILFIETKHKQQSTATFRLILLQSSHRYAQFVQISFIAFHSICDMLYMDPISTHQRRMETFPIFNWYDFRVDLVEDIKVVVFCNLVAKELLLLSSKKISRK
ncbi:hypothetical protein RFI_05842 [Reticulomyxa filosa]|uniref:Uncharacterized protein n=1 Tax=Reticulomyxa filosa TaxID=46433 RepID=X6NZK7_RETFI|nr:hypothetical protein RFI_05842 [Reticulomyxa filosa]|eukprot:ETO31279.1 hypothetical protein RFI_05842 [Reticulomyxa filosa]